MDLIGYIRVSTNEQAGHGYSLGAQETALRTWAKANGHTLRHVIPDVMSGTKTAQLHGREAAIRLIETGLAEGLLVLRYDRATRSTLDAAQLLERSRRADWCILTADGKDSSCENQMFMTDVEMAFAAEECRRISRRTKEALAAAKASGKVLGRRSVIPADVESAILAAHDAGQSARAIAADLTARGVPAPAGGVLWVHSSVTRVLRRYAATVVA